MRWGMKRSCPRNKVWELIMWQMVYICMPVLCGRSNEGQKVCFTFSKAVHVLLLCPNKSPLEKCHSEMLRHHMEHLLHKLNLLTQIDSD